MTQPLQTFTNLEEMTNIVEETDVLSKRTRAMQSQFSASPRIVAWSNVFQKHIDASTSIAELYKKCFNADTAEGIFLDWIGTRVGIPREVSLNGVKYRPEDPTYRKIVKFKMAINVNRLTIANMNRLLSELFGIPISVEDCPNGQVMHIKLTLNQNTQAISSDTIKAIRYYGMIMRPAGVDFDFQAIYEAQLGFHGQELQDFDHGVFNSEEE